jgi:iron complex transport system permease protein
LGFVISAFCAAVVSLILFMSDDMVLRSATIWLSGSMAEAGFVPLRYSIVSMILGLAILLPLGRQLDGLMLGEAAAKSLGIKVGVVRCLVVIASALLTGAAVSLAGVIGFIGMMVPNLLAILFGGGRMRLMIWSGWLGAILLLIIDGAARHVAYPVDVPVGIVLALLGGPFFIWLFVRSSRR